MFFYSPSAATPRHKVDLLEEVSKCVKSGIQCILKNVVCSYLGAVPTASQECKKFAGYLGKPTFCVVLCQGDLPCFPCKTRHVCSELFRGLVGTIPNAALSFQLLFMQRPGPSIGPSIRPLLNKQMTMSSRAREVLRAV